MSEIKTIEELSEEEIAQISGGTEEESQEILNYIREHDPNGYAFIVNSKRNPQWSTLRYLYDHGVNLVFYTPNSTGSNSYYIGDKDNLNSATPISHAELMALIREKIH